MLMEDERILGARERALLTSVLQHATADAGLDRRTQEAVRAAIASAVGETVAQRACSVLGASIVEKILERSSAPAREAERAAGEIEARQPEPPGEPLKTPGPPSPPGQPEPPGTKLPTDVPVQPEPPGVKRPAKAPKLPVQPEPPGPKANATIASETVVEITERPAVLPARCVVLDEFLAPQELEELTRFTLAHEAEFRTSEVISATEGGVINYEHRRSRVLMEIGRYENLMLERIRSVLSQVLRRLEMDDFAVSGVEAQITASNDGDFFRFHSDSGSEPVRRRYLTFVYFFHREPRAFEGGELRIHDARLKDDRYVSEGTWQTIVPQQNQIVFFPCELMHEVTAMSCPSGLFADSRFTLNGWLRR